MARGLAFALLLGWLVAPCVNAARDPAPVRADIQVRIDPETRELTGAGVWTIPPGESLVIVLADRFDVRRLTVDGQPRPAEPERDGQQQWPLASNERAARRVEIEWRGLLDPLEAGLDHRQVLRNAAAASSPRGTFLPGAAEWHPVFIGRPLQYTLRVDLPPGQYAIVAGDLVSDRRIDRRRLQAYQFEQPGPAIDLMAGPYHVTERKFSGAGNRSIALRTLFHAEIVDLAAGYLDATERYLRMYERWIGPYPYGSFSIVSSPTPTGFGMPTLTYLGIDVLRLPFIRDTSLGHEVLHNWWGNGVYPDYATGNWSEGLTTFMADHAYREQAGPEAARELRLAWLRDLAALDAGQDRPLREFTSRTHGSDQVVGYHKAAMLFLMLRDAIGEGAFDQGLRRFWSEHRGSIASWDDLRAAFERASQRDLAGFFAQWPNRAGAPDLRLESAKAVQDADEWRVDFALSQDRPAYALRVPVAIGHGPDRQLHWVELDRERATFSLRSALRPDSITLDPDARLLRRLAPAEAPPILRQAMLDPATVTVLVGATEAGEVLAQRFVEHPLQLRSIEAPLAAAPLLLVGLERDVNRYLARHDLPPRPPELSATSDRATAWVWTVARETGAPITVVSARDAQALAALGRPLQHYGRQSWLVFEGGTATARGTWRSRPQSIRLETARGSQAFRDVDRQ
jgi:aminopeptidase N